MSRLPWLTEAALGQMRQIHAATLTERVEVWRAAAGPDSDGLVLHLSDVPMTIAPTPATGTLASVAQQLGGGRAGHMAHAAHGVDILPGDEVRWEGRTFKVLGVGRDWDLITPIALSEVAG